MSSSELNSLLSLSDDRRAEFLAGLSDLEAASLLYDWSFWARPSQREPVGAWRIWLVLSGRGYGKTRVGSEWVRRQVKDYEFVNIAGATSDDARGIMVEGESGILAVCPPWERPTYRRTLRRLDWPNGAKSLVFSADEPERFRGFQHERFWGDEIAAWRYPESLDQMVFGLRLGDDPRALFTTTPKPTRQLRDLVEDPNVIVTKGSTYENRDNLAPGFFDDLITKYEGTRLGRQELDAELLLDEGLAYRFSEHVHVVPGFPIPDHWTRFESMDFGSSNPTCWLAYAVDESGSIVIFDEYYEAGLPSETAPRIHALRQRWYPPNARDFTTYADPSVYDDKSVTNKWGRPAKVSDEFRECGIPLVAGNRDRRAGYIRVAELLKVTQKPRPAWAGPGEGSPSLFVFDRCVQLIDQLRYAPLDEQDEPYPGEAVSRRWEGPHGHAHAALRYGVLSWPGASRNAPGPPPPERSLADVEVRKVKQGRERGRYQY